MLKKILLIIFAFTSLGFSQLIKPNIQTNIIGSYNSNYSLYSRSTMASGLRDTSYFYNIGLGVGNLQNANNKASYGVNGNNTVLGYANLNRDSSSPTNNNIIGNQNLFFAQATDQNNIIGRYNLEYATTGITKNTIIGNVNAQLSSRANIHNNVMIGDSNMKNMQNNAYYNEIIGYNNLNNLGYGYSPNNNIEILGTFNASQIWMMNNVQIIGDNNLNYNGNTSQYFGGFQILGYSCLNAYTQGSGGGNMIAIGGGSGSIVTNGYNDCYIQSNGFSTKDTNMIYIGGFNIPFIYGSYTQRYLNIKVKQLGVDSLGGTLAYHTIIGRTDRTAGIDSLLNGVDTVRTTAYDSNSLVFITDLSSQGSPGHQYIDKANSLPGTYFIVKSMSVTDLSKFNWFILKTY